MSTINPHKDIVKFIYNPETHAVIVYNAWCGCSCLQTSDSLDQAHDEERAKETSNQTEHLDEGDDFEQFSYRYPYNAEDKPLLAAMERIGEICPGMACVMVPRAAVQFMKIKDFFKKDEFLNVSIETMLETQPVDATMWKKLKKEAADIRISMGFVVTVMPAETHSQHMYVVFLDRKTIPKFSVGKVEAEYKVFISAFMLEQMRSLGHIDNERTWHVSVTGGEIETVTVCHESRLGLDGLPEMRHCLSTS